MAEAVSATNYCRKAILNNSNTTYEQVVQAWDAASLPKAGRPVKQHFHTARYQIKQKFGIEEIEKIPRLEGGSLDVISLIKLMVKKTPELSEKQVMHYLRSDGITVTHQMYNEARGRKSSVTPTENPVGDSPDLNQQTGPRARHTPAGRQPLDGRTVEGRAKKDLAAIYLQMEEQLDLLVMEAMNLENTDLVGELRAARRNVIIKGMEATKK